MPLDRRTPDLAAARRPARGAPGRARDAWRPGALALVAVALLAGSAAAEAQTTRHAPGRKAARPARVTPAVADTMVAGTPPAVAATAPTSLTRLAGDTAAGDVAPLPPLIAAPGTPTTAPAAPANPAAPNVPGAPNIAGHLSASLVREDVVAPLVATVSGGSGAEVMHLQVLLDAARFSPGAVSGVWNENTVFAIRAFRGAAHLPPGDSADADVVARLERIVGPRAPLTEYVVTAADVRGPYRRVPGSMYAKAKADCLCYSSMLAMLGERFHATTDVITRLNPDVDVARAPAGTRIVVPNVERGPAPAVARLVIDKREGSIRGLDAHGQTRFWLPATVGSSSLPSPTGRLHVVSTTPNPRYRYDPVVLGESRSVGPNALLPPGPNSPVGVLWAQLSRPHVGLHGTPTPEDVGYTMSHGCVRMANWDAHWLTPRLQPGLTVDFQ
ncbi:hypothetical protein tb265_22990 [Gemmatimonadetes bacterium T265]|nr:hypothetical protein tb265_22990 [Gemmatimonadetes bacterium T265]